MYDRFTDTARKVMQLANLEAERFDQKYIGTEHILLGLLKESSGVAASVLRNLDIDLHRVQIELEQAIHSGLHSLEMTNPAAPPRAKKAIEFAMEEARDLGHDYVGTEHLLLGLMRERDGLAARVLRDQGLRLDTVRVDIVDMLGGASTHEPIARDHPAAEIQDLPNELRQTAAHLDAEIDRLASEKMEAVAEQEFDTAVELREREYEVRQRKTVFVRDWIVNRPIESAWLLANDAALKKLAQRINDERRWQDLPLLANALEAAGCTDRELIEHCRNPGEHSQQCWVVDVILAH